MNARVPTLPTPTTLRATSTISKRSSRCRRSSCSVARYARSCSWIARWTSSADMPKVESSSRAGTTIGGWLTIRYRPSTSSPSLDSAWRLSRVRAFAACLVRGLLGPAGRLRVLLRLFLLLLAFFPAAFFPLAFLVVSATAPRTASMKSSSERWEYQTSIVRNPRELRHRLPVGPDGRQRGCARVRRREPVVSPRDREAGGHPLHVVFERPRQRLVEVVQIEQQPSLRGREHPEVRQVGIAAQLRAETRGRRVIEVRGHDLRRTAVEGERRDHHSAMPDRHQIRLSGEVLLLEQGNRIGPAHRRDATPNGSTAVSAPMRPHPWPCGRRGWDARSA